LSLCILNSRAREGIWALAVTVEVHLAEDLTALSIVGLLELAVKESKDRGRGTLLTTVTSGFRPAVWPSTWHRRTCPKKAGVSTCPSP